MPTSTVKSSVFHDNLLNTYKGQCSPTNGCNSWVRIFSNRTHGWYKLRINGTINRPRPGVAETTIACILSQQYSWIRVLGRIIWLGRAMHDAICSIGLLVEILPSRPAALLSLPTLSTGPIWEASPLLPCRMLLGLYTLLGLLILANDGSDFSNELVWGLQYSAATDLRCFLWPNAKRVSAGKTSAQLKNVYKKDERNLQCTPAKRTILSGKYNIFF